MCVCDRVFGLEISWSGMLDLGLYHSEYVYWGVTCEDVSGVWWCNVVFLDWGCILREVWSSFRQLDLFSGDVLWRWIVGARVILVCSVIWVGVLWVGCACLLGCWPEGVNISGGDGIDYVMCLHCLLWWMLRINVVSGCGVAASRALAGVWRRSGGGIGF
eukprot:330374-Ditylum_brightwellii.AAC.1